MSAEKPSNDELHRLAQSWFAEAREHSKQDNAEVSAWKKQLNKSIEDKYGHYVGLGGIGFLAGSSGGFDGGGGD